MYGLQTVQHKKSPKRPITQAEIYKKNYGTWYTGSFIDIKSVGEVSNLYLQQSLKYLLSTDAAADADADADAGVMTIALLDYVLAS